MNEKFVPLAEQLAVALSDLNVASSLTKGYHWNVKGRDFREFHEFFGELYADFDSAIDPIAESIRQLDFEAPYLLEDFLGMTNIKEERIQGGDIDSMLASLVRINETLLEGAFLVFEAANNVNEQGIANFAAERIDAHRKWNWQLKATLGL
jgi:starvation-inducible DNA-binding protein